jgi:hypothetical protein
MTTSKLQLLDFLDELRRGKIYYRLSQHRDHAIMVEVSVPGERWEIEFMDDGTVEAEVFKSNGAIEGPEAIARLLEVHSDAGSTRAKDPKPTD